MAYRHHLTFSTGYKGSSNIHKWPWDIMHSLMSVSLVSWPENQGILFFVYFSFQMNQISFMVAQANAVLQTH